MPSISISIVLFGEVGETLAAAPILNGFAVPPLGAAVFIVELNSAAPVDVMRRRSVELVENPIMLAPPGSNIPVPTETLNPGFDAVEVVGPKYVPKIALKDVMVLLAFILPVTCKRSDVSDVLPKSKLPAPVNLIYSIPPAVNILFVVPLNDVAVTDELNVAAPVDAIKNFSTPDIAKECDIAL